MIDASITHICNAHQLIIRAAYKHVGCREISMDQASIMKQRHQSPNLPQQGVQTCEHMQLRVAPCEYVAPLSLSCPVLEQGHST